MAQALAPYAIFLRNYSLKYEGFKQHFIIAAQLLFVVYFAEKAQLAFTGLNVFINHLHPELDRHNHHRSRYHR